MPTPAPRRSLRAPVRSVRLAERNAFVVSGIPFAVEEIANDSAQLLSILSSMALVGFVAVVLSLGLGFTWGAVWITALLLPCCGYAALLGRSSIGLSLVSCASAVVAVVYSVGIIVSLAGGGFVTCACDPACAEREGIADAPRLCRNQQAYLGLWWLSVILGMATASLLCGASYYAGRLAASPHLQDGYPAVVVPLTEVWAQPATPPPQPPPPAPAQPEPAHPAYGGAGGSPYYTYAAPTTARWGAGESPPTPPQPGGGPVKPPVGAA